MNSRLLVLALLFSNSHANGQDPTKLENAILVPDTQSCYETLTNNFSQDSRAESVYMDDIFYREGDQHGGLAWASDAAQRMMAKLGCKIDLIPSDSKLNRCVRISFAEVCELHSNAGYFVIVKDMVDTGTVIFNRFD